MHSTGNRKLGFASLIAVSPTAGFLVGLFHPRDPASRNLVWVFIIFYGAFFYIAEGSGSDSVRYAELLRLMNEPGFTFEELLYLYGGQAGFQDIYQPFITFIISRFTDQHWVLFGCFGVLLGYVYSRNIWFLIDRIGNRQPIVAVFLILAFAMNVSFAAGLNGVRFWTACHVFVFGFLFFSSERDPKYLFIALLTPLIHFSYVMVCLPLLIFMVVKRFGTQIYVFLLASFFFSQLDLTIIKTMMQYLPFSFEDRALSYVNKVGVSSYYGGSRATPWFLIWNNKFLEIFILLASTYMFRRGYHRIPSVGREIFLFGMLIYGATNLVSYVPSAGRFLKIGELLIIAALILFLGNERARKNDVLMTGALSSMLMINTALGVKMCLEFTSVYVVFGNFFIAPFVDANVALYEMIRR